MPSPPPARLDAEAGAVAEVGPAAVAVVQRVPRWERERYESWLATFHRVVADRPGFQSVDVVRHSEGDDILYTVLTRFDGSAARDAWLASDALADLRQTLGEIAGAHRVVQQGTGRELWFDLAPPGARAPFWKRAVLSAACVYPLLLIANATLGRLLGRFPAPLALAVTVVVLSCVLTYPVMPLATRWARPWLYNRGKEPTGGATERGPASPPSVE
ncbi:hypothetical protein RQM47_10985 [Rubrivirga sp. S365]|uniref:ABM domain-containing protein n=1 Tax=Rubrivirga litoralis TaxID=3075598 RepID=A0ABU3BTN8_9BACT|nr:MULTISPECIES: antibiotic biosynthesis monooxygenase [unclassified Rubrivirga]MDT0632658.1 hypothetical protein [Rubrivirga sp. F394]MDT7857165.1 hypothetical protein [Rubrivirga sp. S365]